ncbi:unnamed protein product [Orchesella dallaii]|uniref:dolichyl-phosphate beta-glucosyltransferase n=1 Tax=Orchesella dallaii TaxID=48710 RepID=A0ABP1QJP5_9HEXA
MDFEIIIWIFLLLITLIGSAFLFCFLLLRDVKPYPQWKRYDTEKYYEDPETGIKCPFPSLSDSPSLTLSVIVPAYNEEDRLTPMMEDCLEYLERRCDNERSFSYEIVIVNDGSTDNTSDVAMGYVRRCGCDRVRLLNLEKNRGKGGAVRLGVFSSRGEYIIFADADGATRFSDIDKVFSSIKILTEKGKATYGVTQWRVPSIACGSRAHMEEDSIATRSFFRTLLMHAFHFLVWLFTVRGIRDTQCGFKMFTRSAARIVFHNLHIERWAFDVELLYIAQKLRMPIDEVAVYWTEIAGSKVTPILSWIQMGIDLFAIWLRYTTGRWRLANKGD